MSQPKVTLKPLKVNPGLRDTVYQALKQAVGLCFGVTFLHRDQRHYPGTDLSTLL